MHWPSNKWLQHNRANTLSQLKTPMYAKDLVLVHIMATTLANIAIYNRHYIRRCYHHQLMQIDLWHTKHTRCVLCTAYGLLYLLVNMCFHFDIRHELNFQFIFGAFFFLIFDVQWPYPAVGWNICWLMTSYVQCWYSSIVNVCMHWNINLNGSR